MTNPTHPDDKAGVTSPADDELLDILQRVQSGELSVEEAEQLLGPAPGRREEQEPAKVNLDSENFSAPLGKTANGKLVFERGVAGLTVQGESLPGQLFKAHFDHHVPVVRVNGGTVTVRYRDFGFNLLNWLRYGFKPPHGHITLNADIPWQIAIRGGLAQTRLDLSTVTLRKVAFSGGLSDVEVRLGEPADVVKLDFTGGVHNISILRPATVAVRLSIHGGVANLALDNQKFGAVGGMTTLETPNGQEATSYYAINIHGGAHNLKVIPL